MDWKNSVVAGTGHRPGKLGGYSAASRNDLINLARGFLLKTKPKKIISGMALGWDLAWAEAAVELRIPLVAAVPFAGQENIWPSASKELYAGLLAKAEEVHIVSPGGYSAHKMQVRNRWMVDNSDATVALWDGSSGGTANCIAYTKDKAKPLVNLWEDWEQLRRMI